MSKIKNNLMFKLNPKFITLIFKELVSKFGDMKNASKILNIPYSSFRGYKNGYFSSLPKRIVKKILNIGIISEEQFNDNLLLTYHRQEQNKGVLDKGRELRLQTLRKWKQEIPKLNEIIIQGNLNFERWFLSYQKLINFGARRFNYIRKKGNLLEVSYITHSNKQKKEFILEFPKKIKIDNNFIYFLGLWIGDKAGGKRFGIMNKEPKIVEFTKEYLSKKLYQTPEVVLYIAEEQEFPKEVHFNKVVKIRNKNKGYAFSTHVVNGILTSFFNYLELNLDEFISLIKEVNIFFAGLFDAEGNLFLEDSCFRWSCKNNTLIPIFKKYLNNIGLFNRYDGSNLVAYNKSIFSEKILPFLIHPKKINNSNLICFGKGYLEKRFRDILRLIRENPGITNNELTKLLKRKKSYAQVRVLEKLGCIYSQHYPKQLFINNKLDIVT